MKYLLDTNIISEPMRKKPNKGVINRLASDSIFSCTSATVWFELWQGIFLLENEIQKNKLSHYLNFLKKEGIIVLPFCEQSAEWLASESVSLRKKGITLTKNDSEIAAVCVINQLTLVTRNIDDFSMFSQLKIEDWFE